MDHTAGNLFRARGVVRDDAVYIINLRDGKLRIIGRMIVRRVGDFDEARRVLPYEPWEAEDHLFATKGTGSPLYFDANVPNRRLTGLEFIDAKGDIVSPRFDASGRPDRQTFRGVREITEGTASTFDAVLSAAKS